MRMHHALAPALAQDPTLVAGILALRRGQDSKWARRSRTVIVSREVDTPREAWEISSEAPKLSCNILIRFIN